MAEKLLGHRLQLNASRCHPTFDSVPEHHSPPGWQLSACQCTAGSAEESATSRRGLTQSPEARSDGCHWRLLGGARERSWLVTRAAKKRTNASHVKDQQTPLPLGTLVYIRNFVRKWKDCKFNGPFPVTDSTTTAVKVQGDKPWYHFQDIRLAPTMPSIPLDTEQEKEGGEQEKQPE
ncbi:hypothetical protein NDU88_007629 [Pleurodeles waltl]|uniref:Murine leukemia virus integrase C-terminal domain-containing protein n=1 Tax=Pleurodeles waltl TaxID=8319 RepID=A0AAV7PS04_PLEWA|nr:hypothetical protein NDU88_007629 [Pleurodeles waltl]